VEVYFDENLGCRCGRQRISFRTAAMVVDESRILQVSIFSTLHKNEHRVEFSKLLPDVVTIADEVDAQLKQQILCFLPAKNTGKPEAKK
jgi:hypothetical protein